MSIAIQTDPVPLEMDDDGAIRVGGTRVSYQDKTMEQAEQQAEEISPS
ncbi:MAG: hypothetical protein ACLP9L_30015 [Thermoguttaceae bacterium]